MFLLCASLLAFHVVESLALWQAPPRVELGLSRPHVYPVGSIVQLKCPVEPYTKDLFIEWSKGTESINILGRYRVTLRGYLRIKDSKVEDSGVYSCKAINGFGQVDINVTLQILKRSELLALSSELDNCYASNHEPAVPVSVPPSKARKPLFVRKSPTYATRALGSSLTLHCSTLGHPRPALTWLKDGQKLELADLPAESHMNNESLYVSHLRLDDGGNYSCIAVNNFGESRASFQVVVKGGTQNIPDVHIIYMDRAKLNVGDQISLVCKVVSSTSPLIQWLKKTEKTSDIKSYDQDVSKAINVDGEYFLSIKSIEKSYYQGYYTKILQIQTDNKHDAGKYICLAVNMAGYSYETVHMSVFSSNKRNSYVGKSTTILVTVVLFLLVCFSCALYGIVVLTFTLSNMDTAIKCHSPSFIADVDGNRSRVMRWLFNSKESNRRFSDHSIDRSTTTNRDSSDTHVTAISV